MDVEREFNFTIQQGGVPGVILPKRYTFAGR